MLSELISCTLELVRGNCWFSSLRSRSPRTPNPAPVSAPLVISDVHSSCGCTVPKKPKEPIMPGETGEIEVKYDTNRVMPIRKTITVLSNADTPSVSLKIKGNPRSGRASREARKF